MNVFIIPSWYPSKKLPVPGIFFKEQASYIAEQNPDINLGISMWGQSDPDLLININLLNSAKNALKFFLKKDYPHRNFLQKNLLEILTPSLRWSHKIFGGSISQIVDANLKNLEVFEKEFGKADIIHAHVSYPAGYIAMILSKKFNIPYVITEHMGPFPFQSFVSDSGEINAKLSNSVKGAKEVIAVSPKYAEDIKKTGLKDPMYIPNVIDEDFFQLGEPVSVNPFKFFTLANLSPEKGIDDLLQAISIVIKKNDNVLFNIGGGGYYLKPYKEKATKLGINKHVNWLGQLTRSEAREQYQKCNAFVLPSHGESFGVVYAEAVASGKPVIATPCGGPECIVNENNGIFANVKDPYDLSEKMLFMIDNYQSFQPQKIRKTFEDNFSKKAVIPKIVAVYKSIVKEQA